MSGTQAVLSYLQNNPYGSYADICKGLTYKYPMINLVLQGKLARSNINGVFYYFLPSSIDRLPEWLRNGRIEGILSKQNQYYEIFQIDNCTYSGLLYSSLQDIRYVKVKKKKFVKLPDFLSKPKTSFRKLLTEKERKEYRRNYNKNYKETHKDYFKQYTSEHKEKFRANAKRQYYKDLKESSLKNKEFRLKHPDYMREYSRKRREELRAKHV